MALLSAADKFCLLGRLSWVLAKLYSLIDTIVSTMLGVLTGTKSDLGLKFLCSKGPKVDFETDGRVGCFEGPGFLAFVCF